MANSWRYAKSKQCVGIPATATATQYVAVGSSVAACNHPFSSSFSFSSENPEIQEITKKLQQIDPFRRHLNVEVVDDTALIDTSFISKKKAAKINTINRPQEISRNNVDKKKKKMMMMKIRRKRKGRKNWKIKKTAAADNKKEKKAPVAYSRAEMVALGLQNVDDQRNKWSEVYAALAASVAAEYDGLVAVRGPTFVFYRRPFMENKPHNIDGAAMGKRSPLKICVH